MKINWHFILSKSWKAALMGILIATGIALFPAAQCAVAQTCGELADRWCGENKCCGFTGGMRIPSSCRNRNMTVVHSYRCNPQTGNCNVSDWMGYRDFLTSNYPVSNPGDLIRIYNGRTQARIPECDWRTASWLPQSQWPWAYVDCCTGSSGSGGGCTPEYAPPTIDDTYTVDPPNPIVWTQEQPPYGLALGMTLNDIKAHGGQDTACGTGRANITNITVSLTLQQASIDWILGELSQRYINVRIKDTYPKYPETAPFGHQYAVCSTGTGVIGAGTPDAELDCRFFRPLDPGKYDVTVTACQSDGKCTTKTLPQPVSVWLMENTLSGSWR